MIESRDIDDPLRDIEAIVRAAGHYVRASNDLRPRVLEAARVECGERRARRTIRHAAVFFILLAMFFSTGSGRMNFERTRSSELLLAAGFHRSFLPPEASTVRHGDGDWRMTDAFTELRRQQAQLLRFAL